MGRWGDGEMKLMCSVVSANNWYYISWPRFRDYFRNIAFIIVIRYTEFFPYSLIPVP
ncbi:MAG: hypothetical protein F6J94_31630 [Moorea sp. SIO1F2]|uniref:hypothetical protein n=1 Tax=Moorena sp. SIO1F2 TaxID=2607819 RepID=UPI0013B89953|nr:hypothetical protein [Moorena sp. SIO1F2]NET86259.1 hypothetical protein [Moorena sp. SIO1F2]